MGPTSSKTPALRSRFAIVGVLACLALLIFGVARPDTGSGRGTVTPFVTLGGAGDTSDPACPVECRAIGSVTGFQVSITDADSGNVDRLPYRVPFRRGRVTSWSLELAQPTNSQEAFFNKAFGRPPQARIGVLRKIRGSSPPRYRLVAQGPVRVLTQFLGTRARFRLRRPIPVRRGDVISLTVPTWAPAFAIDLTEDDVWRASRERGKCLSESNQRRGRPHQVVGSRRNYSCRYGTARLLYTATVVRRSGR